jgi:HSP20 family protein
MSLIKWNPYGNLTSLNDEVERFFKGFGLDPVSFDTVWYPSVDVFENPTGYEVKAELPGMKKDDIKITVEENVLTIQGEKKLEQETQKKNVQLNERYNGKFRRCFRLPGEVRAGGIKASYKDGVLTVELPKAEEAKPKEIEIG